MVKAVVGEAVYGAPRAAAWVVGKGWGGQGIE